MFATELELIETLTSNKSSLTKLVKWACDEETQFLVELDLGFGKADVVLAKSPNFNRNRYNPLTYSDITILKAIETHGRTTLRRLMECTQASGKSVKKSIQSLLNEGFIGVEGDSFISINQSPEYTETLAIEAKLKDWKRALKQAYRYKWFSFYSYVLMDEVHVTPARKNKDMFERYNVGLATLSKSGEIEILFRPQKTSPVDERMQALLSEHLCFRSEK